MTIHSWSDLQAVPPKRMWQLLRTLRRTPPGRANRGNRKETFNAAMEQAEQLFRAADGVGTAARPLLTFYGVSQLGRAIAAASTLLDNNESRLSGHGLKDGALTDARSSGLASVTIRGESSGAFPTVAKALRASAFTKDQPLGAIWNLIPDATRFALPDAGGLGPVTVTSESHHVMRTSEWASVHLAPIPLELLATFSPDMQLAQALQQSNDNREAIVEERLRLKAWLGQYPSLSDFEFLHYIEPEMPVSYMPDDSGESLRVRVRLPLEAEATEADEIRRRTHEYHGVLQAYPSFDESNLAAHPLLAWWAVLYVLSRLARYEPRDWVHLTTISESGDAVPIEYLLDEAQSALPELAYRAIQQVSS